MKRRPTSILAALSLMMIGLMGCAEPTETEQKFSTQPEILVFSSNFELIGKSPRLRGLPMDMHLLEDGSVMVGVDGGGLVRFKPDSGELGRYFGPAGVTDFEMLDGRPIGGTSAAFLVGHYHSNNVKLLDGEGNVLRTLPAPVGLHDVDVLENGNLLRVDARANKVREASPTGEVVWESSVPLLNPYEVITTPRNTLMIADFDNHRLLEINRENQVVQNIAGLHHPRRMQRIDEDYYLIADSDNKRIVALLPDKRIVPIIEGLNRPLSLAFDTDRQRLFVGVEPFFQPPRQEPTAELAWSKGMTLGIWLGVSLALVIGMVLWRVNRERLAVFCNQAGNTWRRLIDTLGQPMVLLAILLAALACWRFAWANFVSGWILLIPALILMIAARHRSDLWFEAFPSRVAREEDLNEDIDEESEEDQPVIQNGWLILLGLLISVLPFIWTLNFSEDWWPVIPWVAGPILTVLGFRKRYRPAPDIEGWFWVLGIVAAALFFRLYQIGSIPYGLWLDEVYAFWNSIVAMENGRLAPFETTPLVRPNEFDTTNLYLLILGLFSKYAACSFLVVKLNSILPSVGIVLGTYFLGKWSFTPWVGRLAGTLAAVISWMVTFGRWGWLQQLYIMLAVFALAFFIRAWRWKCPRSAAITGWLLGLGFFTYIPIVITTATIVGLFILGLPEGSRKLRFAQLAIVLVLLAQVFAPLGAYYVENPNVFLARAQSAGIMNEVQKQQSLDPLISNVNKYLLAFHVYGDFNPRHGIPRPQVDPETGEIQRDPNTGEMLLDTRRGRPMLDPITGGLFLLGLAMTFTRFYRPSERMLLISFALAMVGGILSLAFEAPNTFRLGVVPPIVCVLAALPLASLIRERERASTDEEAASRWPYVAVAIVLLFIAGVNYYRYFHLYPSATTWAGTFGAREHLIYEQLSADEIGRERLFVHPEFTTRTFQLYMYFLEEDKEGVRQAKLRDNSAYSRMDIATMTPALAPGQNLLYMPQADREVILQKFPDAQIHLLENPYGQPQLIEAVVER